MCVVLETYVVKGMRCMRLCEEMFFYFIPELATSRCAGSEFQTTGTCRDVKTPSEAENREGEVW